MRAWSAAALLLIAPLLAAGCGGGPVDPSKNVTETFPGTLQPQGGQRFTMSINNTGEFSVKITALSPNPTSVVGTEFDFGANCEALVQRNNFSTLNTVVLNGPILQKGPYCVVIYDIGVLTTAQNFTITVSHP
jgi:hypothetical protein